MKWAKITALVLFALAVIAALTYGFIPKPVPCEFVTVSKGDIRVTIDEEARTRVKDRFVVSAPLPGMLTRISLKAGDRIEAGATIAVLTPLRPNPLDARALAQAQAGVKAAGAALDRAGSDVAAAVAQHELRVKEHNRMKDLLRGKHVSQEQVDIAQTQEAAALAALQSARFGEQAARFQLEMANAALIDDATAPTEIAIKSPVSGQLLQVMRTSEGPVQTGEPLVELGDPARLEVVADLNSADAVRVRAGMRVSIERWGGERALQGEVRRVEPFGFTKHSSLGVEEQRVNVIIDLHETPQALGDGFRVEARIIISEHNDVVKVPVGALFRHGDSEALFVVAGGRAVRRAIEIGGRGALEVEALSGLKAGDVVIVHPGDDVEDGGRVVER